MSSRDGAPDDHGRPARTSPAQEGGDAAPHRPDGPAAVRRARVRRGDGGAGRARRRRRREDGLQLLPDEGGPLLREHGGLRGAPARGDPRAAGRRDGPRGVPPVLPRPRGRPRARRGRRGDGAAAGRHAGHHGEPGAPRPRAAGVRALHRRARRAARGGDRAGARRGRALGRRARAARRAPGADRARAAARPGRRRRARDRTRAAGRGDEGDRAARARSGVVRAAALRAALVVIDVDLARRLVAAQFPQWADLPVAPVELDGWDNRTFRLGSKLSLRLPSGDWYAPQVDKEQTWLPRLAAHLPLPIPQPVARGEPGEGYPYPWSVYRWLEGVPASSARVANPVALATALASFLVALRRAPAAGGPAPGPHNFFRGGPLARYAEETARALDALGDGVPTDAVRRVFDDALGAAWEGAPVWVHGDVAAGNMLLRDGRLAAVIDFGCAAVGDPACDVVIAWTLFAGASREAFRAGLGVDPATWSRGRGWALWKALITLVGDLERGDDAAAAATRRVIDRVLADHAAAR